MIGTPKPISRHPFENTVTVTLKYTLQRSHANNNVTDEVKSIHIFKYPQIPIICKECRYKHAFVFVNTLPIFA